MKGIWAVAVLTIRDGIRGKAWFPFFIGILLSLVVVVFSFGIRNIASGNFHIEGSYNVISSVFYFWSLGTIGTSLIVASTSFPRERRAPTLFTLPIARWEIAVGKLLGVEAMVVSSLVVGYGVCMALAALSGTRITAYSGLGFATALTISFVYSCVSIPLGIRLSPVVVATFSFIAVELTSIFDVLKADRLMVTNRLSRVIEYLFPWKFSSQSLRTMFYSGIPWSAHDYAGLLINAFIGAVFFIGLTYLFRRDEFSMKRDS